MSALPNLGDEHNRNADRHAAASAEIVAALAAAGLVPDDTPPDSTGRVTVCGWAFRRAWYYWIATSDASLPIDVARDLWRVAGSEVRAGGDCACREPVARGFPGTGAYHIDTDGGLRLFLRLLRARSGDWASWDWERERYR